MFSKLHGQLDRLEVLEPISAQKLHVFGLRCQGSARRLSYLTLDEAVHTEIFARVG